MGQAKSGDSIYFGIYVAYTGGLNVTYHSQQHVNDVWQIWSVHVSVFGKAELMDQLAVFAVCGEWRGNLLPPLEPACDVLSLALCSCLLKNRVDSQPLWNRFRNHHQSHIPKVAICNSQSVFFFRKRRFNHSAQKSQSKANCPVGLSSCVHAHFFYLWLGLDWTGQQATALWQELRLWKTRWFLQNYANIINKLMGELVHISRLNAISNMTVINLNMFKISNKLYCIESIEK